MLLKSRCLRLCRKVFSGLLTLGLCLRAVCRPIREVDFLGSELKEPRSDFFNSVGRLCLLRETQTRDARRARSGDAIRLS